MKQKLGIVVKVPTRYPHYPVEDWSAELKQDGETIKMPRTTRVCRLCGLAFVRGEFPPEIKSLDQIIGYETCQPCAKKFNINGINELNPEAITTQGLSKKLTNLR